VSSESSSLVVREGDNVSLSCEASGYPPPHIVWRREDGDDILIGGRKVRRMQRTAYAYNFAGVLEQNLPNQVNPFKLLMYAQVEKKSHKCKKKTIILVFPYQIRL
jgi:hypothetical protein